MNNGCWTGERERGGEGKEEGERERERDIRLVLVKCACICACFHIFIYPYHMADTEQEDLRCIVVTERVPKTTHACLQENTFCRKENTFCRNVLVQTLPYNIH